MTKQSILVVAAAAVLAATGTAAVQTEFSRPDQDSHATWAQVFTDPRVMARTVGAVVIARAEGTAPGRVVTSSDGQDALAFENVTLMVERSFKNEIRSGETLTVERASGVDVDGGPYVPGHRYVLFVNKQGDTGMYYLVNDQARYSIDSSDRLSPIITDDVVANAFAGKTVSEFASMMRSYMGS